MLIGTNYKACVSLLACMILCQLCCSEVPQRALGWPRLQSARRLSRLSESRAWPSAVRRGRTSTRMRLGPERTEIRFLLFVSFLSDPLQRLRVIGDFISRLLTFVTVLHPQSQRARCELGYLHCDTCMSVFLSSRRAAPSKTQ